MMGQNGSFDPHEYWQSRLENEFSLAGVGFKGLGKEFNTWAYRARRRVLLNALNEMDISPEGCSVLEIGPGTGYYVNMWRSLKVSTVTGLDITRKSACELSNAHPDYDFREMDIGEPDLDLGRQYDIITAFDVLHHVVDDVRFNTALENISRHASQRSIILFMDFFLEKSCNQRFNHQRLRTITEFEDSLCAAGLKLFDLRPVFTLLNDPFDAQREGRMFLRGVIKLAWWVNSNLFLCLARLGQPGRFAANLWSPILYLMDRWVTGLIPVGVSTKLAIAKLDVPEGGAS